MTASETPDAVQPVIPEEAVEQAAQALYADWHTAGSVVADEDSRALVRRDVTVVLVAAYPVLRSVIEAEVRERIASEFLGKAEAALAKDADYSVWGFVGEAINRLRKVHAQVARGSGATRKDKQG